MPPTSPQQDPAYLSPKDAARLLGVNTKTIHQMIADGLPHLRVSNRIIRIDRRDLVEHCKA